MTRTEEVAALVAAAPEGLQTRAVAEALGISEKAARSALKKAEPLGVVAILAATRSVWTTPERRAVLAAKIRADVKANELATKRAYEASRRPEGPEPVWCRVPNSVFALGSCA